MKKLIRNKRLFIVLLAVVTITAVYWDFATSVELNVEEGTYRYESDFDAVTGATWKVAIVPSDYEELDNPIARTEEPSYEVVEEMVREAIELQGGLDWIIEKGDKVLLKVNLVGEDEPSGSGENTDVRVPKALIKIIDEVTEGDVEIVIAEGTARTNDDFNEEGSVWHNSGYVDLLTDSDLDGINFSLFNLNQTIDDLIEVTLGDKATAAPHDGKYSVHMEELEADVYISVPVLKIHNTGITNALKNQIGTAPGCYYGYNKKSGTSYHDGLVHDDGPYRWTTEEIVDLSTIADIDFVVVDALVCLERYKTNMGDNQVRMNTIVAGVDPVAVDHVCARLFCLNPDDIAHITLAEKIGLGSNDPDNIKLRGAAIEDVREKVEKNPTENGQFGQSNRTWILSKAYSGSDITTEYITDEANYTAEAEVDDWSEPVYFFDDRIDLYSYYGGESNIVTYAFTYFISPSDMEAELWLGTHEAIYIYINGELVYSFIGTNSYNDDDIHTYIENITIKEGENSLLVKTLNRFGDYSFALNICEPESDEQYEGNRVDGLTFNTKKSTVTSIDSKTTGVQPDFKIIPNPVTNYSQIEFTLPFTSKTSIKVFDINGKLVSIPVNEYLNAGKHSIEWNALNSNGSKLVSGTYICKLKARNFTKSIKIVMQ